MEASPVIVYLLPHLLSRLSRGLHTGQKKGKEMTHQFIFLAAADEASSVVDDGNSRRQQLLVHYDEVPKCI